jgi:hypothetical protein
MRTQLRTQFTNRTYETKYDNETYKFIKNLNPDGMFKDTAAKVGVTYFNLYSAFKINRIIYRLKTKIDKAFNLTEEQKDTLKTLVVK